MLSLLACDASNPGSHDELVPVPATPPTLQVDIGTGEADFVELTDGSPVGVVYGSQGGFHVWTAVRVHNDQVRDVQVNLTTRLPDGLPAGVASRAALSLSPSGAGTRTAAGLRNLVNQDISVAGTRFVLRVEVIGRDMQHGAAERLVTSRGLGK